MARIDVPEGPGGEAAMIWSLRPQLGGMVERMIHGAYQQSVLPPEERELARMRIAQINECVACSEFRAPSVQAADIAPELYDHVADFATYPALRSGSDWRSSTPSCSRPITGRSRTISSPACALPFATTRSSI